MNNFIDIGNGMFYDKTRQMIYYMENTSTFPYQVLGIDYNALFKEQPKKINHAEISATCFETISKIW